ncbi:MAG: hypothetical protein ACHQ49_06600 [Elusimicrobiota bacterium]
MRSKPLVLAASAALFAAGCRQRAPAPAPDDAVSPTALEAPAPSSTVVTSPLGSGASGYTNEMQAQNLRAEAAQLGISRFTKPSIETGIDGDGPVRSITAQEGIQRMRSMAREAETERHAIEGDKNKSVAIPTETPGVLPPNRGGAPIENPAGDAGPKDPQTP